MINGQEVALMFVVLTLFVLLFYGPWQSLCVSWCRQELFEARNRLFRLAEDGGWSFDSPEYRVIRRFVEINIRFAHRISWIRLAILIFARSYLRKQTPERIETVVRRIEDPRIREAVRQELANVARSCVLLLARRSLILLSVALIGSIAFVCIASVQGFIKQIGWQIYASIQDEAQMVEGIRAVRVRQH